MPYIKEASLSLSLSLSNTKKDIYNALTCEKKKGGLYLHQGKSRGIQERRDLGHKRKIRNAGKEKNLLQVAGGKVDALRARTRDWAALSSKCLTWRKKGSCGPEGKWTMVYGEEDKDEGGPLLSEGPLRGNSTKRKERGLYGQGNG